MIDTFISLGIITVSMLVWFGYVRWDMVLERRAQEKFDADLAELVRERESDV